VFRKFSYSLAPEVSQRVEEILDENEIADEELESTIEMLALEYSKQEDVNMKVDLNILERVYQGMRNQTEQVDEEKEFLDPESHLAPGPLTVSGTAESRILAIRNRLNIIKQCVLRNEHFAPSTLPSKDRERFVT
ncbi:hypothetical protein C0993_001857, partial [Termitomyces sp. T159_Od127]